MSLIILNMPFRGPNKAYILGGFVLIFYSRLIIFTNLDQLDLKPQPYYLCRLYNIVQINLVFVLLKVIPVPSSERQFFKACHQQKQTTKKYSPVTTMA